MDVRSWSCEVGVPKTFRPKYLAPVEVIPFWNIIATSNIGITSNKKLLVARCLTTSSLLLLVRHLATSSLQLRNPSSTFSYTLPPSVKAPSGSTPEGLAILFLSLARSAS